MLAILSVLVVVALSVLITRVATVALIHTGLSRESARFQARSAFTGVGFTTPEAELVVNHPVRRRIVMLLMLLGNAGIVTVIGGLILSFIGPQGGRTGGVSRLLVLLGGAAVLWLAASSPVVDRWLSRVISRALARWTHLEVRDYGALLHLRGAYRVHELEVMDGDWVAGRTLAETRLRHEGLTVLGIERPDGSYIGTPKGDTPIRPGDVVILYGRADCVRGLDTRRSGRAGEREHEKAVAAQEQIEREETGERQEQAPQEQASQKQAS